MVTKFHQSLFLTLTTCLYIFGVNMLRNESPLFAVKEMLSNCNFNSPGEFRLGPYTKSIKWCETTDKRQSLILMNHMEVNSGGLNAVFAAEFGSNVQIALLVDSKIFLINPEILEKSKENIICITSGEEKSTEHHTKSSAVRVKFKNKRFEVEYKWFSRLDACLIQAIIEQM